jgi:hypothetical protein
MTPLPLNVDSVSAGINSVADSVITTRTSAPDFIKLRTSCGILYAAIPPVMPSNILLLVGTGPVLIQQLLVRARLLYTDGVVSRPAIPESQSQ